MSPRSRVIVLALGVALLAAVPPLAAAFNQPFYLDLVRRIMIFAIAAASLNLILGYGGMISFGHAAYLGVGAYAVGILAHYGVHNGVLQWTLAVGASALVAVGMEEVWQMAPAPVSAGSRGVGLLKTWLSLGAVQLLSRRWR